MYTFLINVQSPKFGLDTYATRNSNLGSYLLTLDSRIDVAPGINVAPGTFGKNIKRSP